MDRPDKTGVADVFAIDASKHQLRADAITTRISRIPRLSEFCL
jgi:hypothetical protein